MLIPGKAQRRGERGLLSASQVCRSGLCPPQKGCFRAQQWPGQGDSQVGGVALGFSLLSCCLGSPSLRHHISTGAVVMARCPRVLWRGAGGSRAAQGAPHPLVQSSPSPSPGGDVGFGCLPPISSSTSGFKHKAKIFLPCSIRTKHLQIQQRRKKKPYLGFYAPNLPALDLQRVLLRPTVQGYRSTPFLCLQVKRNVCQLLGG